MLILSEADVAALVSIPEAVAAAREAYRLQATGEGTRSVRGDLRREDPKAGCLLLAGARGSQHLTVKSNVHAYPGGTLAPRLWGSLLTLWDWRTARPRALLSSRAFNDHRTAAGFAAAAEALASRQARTLALFGAGKSAPMTLRYLKAVRPSLATVNLVGRSPERVQALRGLAASWPDFAGVDLRTPLDPATAVEDADIVATVTTSDHPVFPGGAAKPGACVILGGANRPTAREADDALMARADLYLDARAGALDKAGDVLLAMRSGALVEARVAGEIGAYPDAPRPLPAGADLRVFKSMGLPMQDVLLAERLVSRAEADGRGLRVDLEGVA